MIEKFTKLMLSLALLVAGAVGASAEKLYADMSKMGNGPISTWDGSTNTMSWTTAWNNMITDPDFGFTGIYDISAWETLNVTMGDLTGEGIRVDMIDESQQSDAIQLKLGNTTHTIKLSDFKKNGESLDLTKVKQIRIMGLGGSGSAVISEIYLERPDDPLALPKDNLSAAILLGNMQSSFGKTTESFNALTDAIAGGEAELSNASATAESLNAATTAINDAISGFEYEPGYVKLTADMFKEWDDAINPTSGSSTFCFYVLNETKDQPYGDGSVSWKKFADLSEYNKLQIVAYSGVPRICMNRLTADGQIASKKEDSKMLDINSNNGITWATEAYCSKDGKVFTIDLNSIIDDYGYARLNCIKNQWGDPLVVTDLLLYQAQTVTVGDSKFVTFSSTKNVKIQGVTAYKAKVNGNYVALEEVTEVPAGQAVIIEAEANDYELPVIDSAAAIEDNDLKVSDGTVTGDNIYVLANKNSVVGFYKLGAGVTVPAGKAYLQVEAAGRDFIGFGTETTGIKNVESVKGEGEVYNLKGQRVAAPTKGLYVVDGKKVVLK